MSKRILELFGRPATAGGATDWAAIVRSQACPFLGKKCIKVRKSQPRISIGSCTVTYGAEGAPSMICPFRFLERRQVFTDALHLLSLHEPGNELHVVPEVSVPGGSVDYLLVSAHEGKAVDFVGIELQTLDTTGTVWPARQRFLSDVGVHVPKRDICSTKSYGMNWKMTAKTILVQLHHKVSTFEHIAKHLVLVIQDRFLGYMRREFSFAHVSEARQGHALHVHAYKLDTQAGTPRLQLAGRWSTDAAGVATALGLQVPSRVELESILAEIQKKLCPETLWTPV